MLAGDSALRAFAATLSVVCRGVLWALDQTFDAGESNPEELVAGLVSIGDHPTCRLSRDEVAQRIALYHDGTQRLRAAW